MSLFPQSFIDELKSHGDIVQIVQERGVVLKRSGSSWKGLCPFHGEKTPSFHVYDKGLFKCYGCGVGGDVIKFVELYDKITFPEAVRQLAARVGMPVPEGEGAKQDAEDQRERETLLKAHEVAAEWFRQQLAAPAGAAARRQLAERGLTAETIERMGIGYARPAREALKTHLLKDGFSLPALVRSRPARPARRGGPDRPVPQPAHDPDPPRQRRDHRLRRPRHGRRAGAEVPQLP
jgi:DNA primase